MISNEFFEFLTVVVTEVMPFILRLDQQDSTEYKTQYGGSHKRIGVLRLRALEFLEFAQSKLGARIRIHYKEADIYSVLLDYFEAFPFNDLALQ